MIAGIASLERRADRPPGVMHPEEFIAIGKRTGVPVLIDLAAELQGIPGLKAEYVPPPQTMLGYDAIELSWDEKVIPVTPEQARARRRAGETRIIFNGTTFITRNLKNGEEVTDGLGQTRRGCGPGSLRSVKSMGTNSFRSWRPELRRGRLAAVCTAASAELGPPLMESVVAGPCTTSDPSSHS